MTDFDKKELERIREKLTELGCEQVRITEDDDIRRKRAYIDLWIDGKHLVYGMEGDSLAERYDGSGGFVEHVTGKFTEKIREIRSSIDKHEKVR